MPSAESLMIEVEVRGAQGSRPSGAMAAHGDGDSQAPQPTPLQLLCPYGPAVSLWPMHDSCCPQPQGSTARSTSPPFSRGLSLTVSLWSFQLTSSFLVKEVRKVNCFRLQSFKPLPQCSQLWKEFMRWSTCHSNWALAQPQLPCTGDPHLGHECLQREAGPGALGTGSGCGTSSAMCWP